MEADLARYYSIDYRDRWRIDPETGRPLLTLRRLAVLVEHLPPTSAVFTAARGGRPHWSIEAHLLDDNRMALTGTKKQPAKPHPARPRPSRRAPDPAAVTETRRAIRARRRAIEAGEIT